MSQDDLRNCKFVTEVKYKFQIENLKVGNFPWVVSIGHCDILSTQDNQFLVGIAHDKIS